MFEPTGWGFLGVLVVGFGALLYWLVKTRHAALKCTAGALAFAVSSLFGAALVNQSYAYYTTWGALFADANGSGVVGYQAGYGPAAQPHPPGQADSKHDEPKPVTAPPPPTLTPLPSSNVAASITISSIGLTASRTAGSGRVVRLDLAGAQSGIARKGYVYLPPQYFESAYATVSFPVIELLHGDPGDPTNWIYGLNLPDLLDHEIDSGTIGPMVVVMPGTFDGKHGQDCVDAPRGELDDTYLSSDVPTDLVREFRVLPPGPHWAIGGLSDGGFCAANLALRHPGSYGAVVSLDGFYSAYSDLAVMDKVFGAGASRIRANDPSTQALDVRYSLPRFWIMSGSANSIDTTSAQVFRQIVTTREPIDYVVVHNGKHTPPAWRVVLPSLLTWSWDTISGGVVGTGTTQLAIAAGSPASPAPRASPATARPVSPPAATLAQPTSSHTPMHP